jgi:hypothetical protein
MSDPSVIRRLPPWLAPRDREQPGTGSMRLVETTLLLLLGLLLAIATVNDVSRQVKVNDRLTADLVTWRQYTGHRYHNVGVDERLLGVVTQRDVACGNASPGPPKARAQLCLVLTGPTSHGHRRVAGGWYLPPHTEDDVFDRRYGCFGELTKGLCPR